MTGLRSEMVLALALALADGSKSLLYKWIEMKGNVEGDSQILHAIKTNSEEMR